LRTTTDSHEKSAQLFDSIEVYQPRAMNADEAFGASFSSIWAKVERMK
jgi:hypothetical protein